jgi:hypothetical protein
VDWKGQSPPRLTEHDVAYICSQILASSLPDETMVAERGSQNEELIMRRRSWIAMMTLPLAMAAVVSTSEAQGKSKGQGREKGGQGKAQGSGKKDKAPVAKAASKSASESQKRGPSDKGNQARAENRSTIAASRGNAAAESNRGRAISRFAPDLRINDVRPAARRFVASNRAAEFVTGGALAYAFARGTPENALLIAPSGRVVSVRNRKGDLLLDMDDDRARTLGAWQVSPLNDQPKGGAPSFCRSGQGHPNWGRQWCLDKGFGLGAQQDIRWGSTRDIGDIIFGRQVTTGNLTRDVLLSLLGPVAFDRLALHALTLGYTDPLTGTWRTDAAGSSVLLVNSGPRPIAELVDTNRDQRSDLMLVALRPW